MQLKDNRKKISYVRTGSMARLLCLQQRKRVDMIIFLSMSTPATMEDKACRDRWPPTSGKAVRKILTGSGRITPALTWCYLISPGRGPARAKIKVDKLKPSRKLDRLQAYVIRFYRRKLC